MSLINVVGDIANINGSAKSGVGGVVHNHEEILMGAVRNEEACDMSVLEIQLFVLEMGLQFVLGCSLIPLIVESNCLEAVSLIDE